jgi:hypothetical protein
MVGGATDPDAAAFDEVDLIMMVRHALMETMGVSARPVFARVFRHKRGIPQYTVGHLDRVALIDEGLARHPGLFVAGSSYRGVSMNACIEDAQKIAGSVLAHLRTVPDSTNANTNIDTRSNNDADVHDRFCDAAAGRRVVGAANPIKAAGHPCASHEWRDDADVQYAGVPREV